MKRRASWQSSIMSGVLVSSFGVVVGAASAQSFKPVEGDGTCPAGYSLVGVDEARAHQQAACGVLGKWYIVRLAGGGSMDGPGYNCQIRDQDTRALGGSLCKALAITLDPVVPLDLSDPDNLEAAAYFAWNEFIALTWPAQAQGPTEFPRGQAQPNGKYGDAGPTGQVVFETYRHKVEVFPGQGKPNGYDPSAHDYGFSAKPEYVYSKFSGFDDGRIPPVKGMVDPEIPPYNNLDEVTQITLNAMYAGNVNPHPMGGGNIDTHQQEKILFQAKVNEAMYQYVAANQYFDYDKAQPARDNAIFNLTVNNTSQYKQPYMNLLASDSAGQQVGTIEIKTAWRRVNPAIEDPSNFYTAPVRYYVGHVKSGPPEMAVIEGFVDSDQANEIWGLVALHIIHKTKSAPSFIYATFGHINNIVDAEGNDVEKPDGTTKPQYLEQNPFLPALNIVPSTGPKPPVPQKVTKGAGQANTNSPQLYYQNVAGKAVIDDLATGKQYVGPVNINRRIFPIPPTITAANRAAHDAIRAYKSDAIWQNYRLINVQARPLDLMSIPEGEEATYFLANIVVETNSSLQRFSGGLDSSNGVIRDWDSDGSYHINMYGNENNKVTEYNMGGCMGCHGSQGQQQGGDFSVLLARGAVPKPEIVQEDEQHEELMQINATKYLK